MLDTIRRNKKSWQVLPGINIAVIGELRSRDETRPGWYKTPLRINQNGFIKQIRSVKERVWIRLSVEPRCQDQLGVVVFRREGHNITVVDTSGTDHRSYARWYERKLELTKNGDHVNDRAFGNHLMFSVVEGGRLTIYLVCLIVQRGALYLQCTTTYREQAVRVETVTSQSSDAWSALGRLNLPQGESPAKEEGKEGCPVLPQEGQTFVFPRKSLKAKPSAGFTAMSQNQLIVQTIGGQDLPSWEEFQNEECFDSWRNYPECPTLAEGEVWIKTGPMYQQYMIGVDWKGREVRCEFHQVVGLTRPAYLAEGEVVKVDRVQEMDEATKKKLRSSFQWVAKGIRPVNRPGWREDLGNKKGDRRPNGQKNGRSSGRPSGRPKKRWKNARKQSDRPKSDEQVEKKGEE